MSVQKIAAIVGILLAVVAAFVEVPYAGVLLAIAGIVVALEIGADIQVRVIVSALAMHAFAGAFDSLPTVGHYLTGILGNIGTVLAGAALLIILRNIFNRLKS